MLLSIIRSLALTAVIAISPFAQTFTDFRFTAGDVGWDLDFVGVIDDQTRTITFETQRWIENIANLRATFEIEGGEQEVKVGERAQLSGAVGNDFRKNVVYTIGSDINYTVTFVSPQASGIPVIKIDAEDGTDITSKYDFVNMNFVLTDPGNPKNDVSKTDMADSIKGRGNTTWDWPKKPYRIKFRDKTSLFGHVAQRNWVLLAEYLDPTFVTTAAVFELGKNVFELPFTQNYHHVQLYLNGEYAGVYVLTEHNQVNPGRVDIDPVEGWFVEIDNYYDAEPMFRTKNYNLPIMIKSPEMDGAVNMDNPAYHFVRDDWDELCDSLASPGFPENGYRDLIDMNTFVDYLLINEFIQSFELIHPKSAFSYKDKGGKISMGPLWDFDWAFDGNGTHTFFGAYRVHVLRHSFFKRLFDDPVFLAKFKERWNEKYAEVIETSGFAENIGQKIRVAVAEDTKRWNVPGGYANDYDPDHAGQIEKMVAWWNNRASWLNTEFNKVDVVPTARDFVITTDNYPEITIQTFTLAAYGQMGGATAILKNGQASAFEIIAGLNQTATGSGGYLASVSVKPKDGLPVGAYIDMLILSGINQGADFYIEVPLSLDIVETIDISTAAVTLSQTSYTYDGAAKTPEAEVILNGKPLAEGADYSLIFANNKNAGEAAITITGKGYYNGSKVITFAIDPAPLILKADDKAIFLGAPEPKYTYTPEGLVNGETAAVIAMQPVFDLDRPFDSSLPGTFAITPSGAEAVNYDIVYAPGTLTVEPPVSVASYNENRAMPQTVPNTEASVLPQPVTNGFSAGPNPVAKSAGKVGFFRQGKRIDNAALVIYDASGNAVRKISVRDNAVGSQAKRQIGSWDLRDARGRLVADGTYLARGTFITADGKSEKASLVISVR